MPVRKAFGFPELNAGCRTEPSWEPASIGSEAERRAGSAGGAGAHAGPHGERSRFLPAAAMFRLE
jgi:hypothetical protein